MGIKTEKTDWAKKFEADMRSNDPKGFTWIAFIVSMSVTALCLLLIVFIIANETAVSQWFSYFYEFFKFLPSPPQSS